MELVIIVFLVALGAWLTTREIVQGQVRKVQLANERRRDELALGAGVQIKPEHVIEGVAKSIRESALIERYSRR